MDYSRADINILKIISKNYYAINYNKVIEELNQIIQYRANLFYKLIKPLKLPIDFEAKTIRFEDKNYSIDELFKNPSYILELCRSYDKYKESLSLNKYYFEYYYNKKKNKIDFENINKL